MAANRRDYADAIATTTVLAWRLPLLWAMAWHPTPARRAEALRMVTEKTTALAQGATAAWLEAGMSGVRLMAGQDPVAKIADAALRPARKTLRANARRLTRKAKF